MQITHDEARRLIQFNMDEALRVQDKAVLLIHLKDCLECRAYAEEMRAVATLLTPVMKKHWNVQPTPLSMSLLTEQKNTKISARTILTMRTAIVSLVFVAFVFSMWQFTLSGSLVSGQTPVGIPPVPTPSVQSTSTIIKAKSCEVILYTVQPDDTLASIADQFSITKEEIRSINGMSTDAIKTAMQLAIPACSFTPTGTVTTTYTPAIRPTTTVLDPSG